MRTLILALLLTATAAHAQQDPMCRDITLVQMYDADVLHATVAGLPKPVTLKVRGVFAPLAGEKARCDHEAAIAETTREISAAFIDMGVKACNPAHDPRANVFHVDIVNETGQNLSDVLLSTGLVAPYEPVAGQATPTFCKGQGSI